MHHRKQKSSANTFGALGKSVARKENGMETMAKLRYLNKKPLCLQYNFASSSNYARKYSPHAKRREQSFLVVILHGLCRLVQWAAKNLQKATVDFLVKPAHELYPVQNPNALNNFIQNETRQQLKRKPQKRTSFRRSDLARMMSSIDYR
ncbi:unnamed protein product [Caenorhabditis bovis]|uniref:Uncharacterized protein n=1 Tax=Caenorhabditis bovis TaxID=2654633 RepID=A0A8S1EA40_9PELO|nr:unnamed protein product [Caenorhabditis bovis]